MKYHGKDINKKNGGPTTAIKLVKYQALGGACGILFISSKLLFNNSLSYLMTNHRGKSTMSTWKDKGGKPQQGSTGLYPQKTPQE